jgi:hypothetical protein
MVDGAGGFVCGQTTLTALRSGFGGLVVSTLASGTQVRGFKPGRTHRIFQGEKYPQHAFLRRGNLSPMSQICCMLKNPVIYVEVGITGQINLPSEGK